MIAAFYQTMWVNAVNSRAISDTSNRFPTSITPSGATFSIWSYIYYRLFWFACRPVARSPHVVSLFEESCRHNQQWVHSFVRCDWASCQAALSALERSLRRLRAASTRADDRHLFDVYRTWVSCAGVVQDALAQRYSANRGADGRGDDGFSKLSRILRRPSLNRTERGVYRWLLQGLVDKLTQSQIRGLPKGYRKIRTDPTPLSYYIAPP